ncbi:MAG: anti-sigma factor [Chloroflexi bacterium]|nr:anti-sigma factor [Chloroflexota bacterium]
MPSRNVRRGEASATIASRNRAFSPLVALIALLLASLLPIPVHAQEFGGVATLGDDQGLLDRLSVQVSALPAAPEGQVYRVWLLSQERRLARPVGELAPDETGAASLTWSQPAAENLLGQYSQVMVSLEAQDDQPQAQPSGALVLQGEVDRGALVQTRRLLFRWPDSRYGLASLEGLRRLSGLALVQALILRDDAQAENLGGAQRKAEHLVNLLEGQYLVQGQPGGLFGDLNHDGKVEDPGDGVGLIRYTWGALDQAQIAWAQALDTQVAETAQGLAPTLQYVLAWEGFARDAGVELAQTDDPGRAQELAEALVTATERIAAGIEARGDPVLEQVAADEGLRPAYGQAVELVRMPLRRLEGGG